MKQILIIGLFLLNGLSYSQDLKKAIIRDDNDYMMYNDTNSPTESTPNIPSDADNRRASEKNIDHYIINRNGMFKYKSYEEPKKKN